MLVECEDIEESALPDNHRWGFCFLPALEQVLARPTRDLVAHGSKIELNTLSIRFIQTVSRHALLYYQLSGDRDMLDTENELEELPAKISYVVVTEEEYDFFSDKYADLVLPMNASLIYVDKELGRVVAEFPFRRAGGDRNVAFFNGQYFDDDGKPLTEDEYDKYLDEMIEDYAQNEFRYFPKKDE